MPERTVIFDTIGFATGEHAEDPSTGRKVALYDYATKGQRVRLSPSEAERLDALGATSADKDADVVTIPEDYSGSGLADALGGEVPNPPDETAKVAGLVNVDAEERDPTASTIGNIDEVAKVAGLALPAGAGVDLHDNERTAGLAAFLNPTAGAGLGAEASASDEELAAMNATETLAYLNQHADEVDRVDAVNLAKTKPSKQVTDAVATIRSVQEEQAAASTSSTPTE